MSWNLVGWHLVIKLLKDDEASPEYVMSLVGWHLVIKLLKDDEASPEYVLKFSRLTFGN